MFWTEAAISLSIAICISILAHALIMDFFLAAFLTAIVASLCYLAQLHFRGLLTPLFLVTLVLSGVSSWVMSLVVGIGFVVRRAKTEIKPGQCKKCRYDLTGNISRRCPECGSEIPGRQVSEAMDREA